MAGRRPGWSHKCIRLKPRPVQMTARPSSNPQPATFGCWEENQPHIAAEPAASTATSTRITAKVRDMARGCT